MSKPNSVRRAVRYALLTSAAAAATSVPAVAQETGEVEEIVVTGSRIVRQDYEAASPVVSVSAEAFQQTGVINAEQLVNTLPQVVPSFSTGSNNPGNGQAYLNLRGLGEERTLILVDGKRMTPGSEDALIDINTIPTALIERVEIISGGASAVYGSDAIAGAVNFILKNDFDGVELNAQYGESAEGDTEEGGITVTLGSDLADGRGNVVMWGTFNDREALTKGDREFAAQATSGTSFFPTGHLRRTSGNGWTLAAQNDMFTNLYGTSAPSDVTTMVANDDGSLFAAGGGGVEGLHNFRSVLGEDQTGQFFAQNFPNGPNTYSYNFEPWNNLVLPQRRVSFGAMGEFAITDRVEAYSRLMYTNYSADTKLAPSPAPTGANNTVGGVPGEFTIPVLNPFVQANPGALALANSRVENIGCTVDERTPGNDAFIPDCELDGTRTGDNSALLGAGPTEDLLYRYRFVENGPRVETYERDVYQFVLGSKGDITENWGFDAYVGHGKFNEQLDQGGNVSVPRVEDLLDSEVDGVLDGGVSICEGGFNPFGGGLSQECADYVGVVAKNTAQIEHNMAEAVITGDLFELPAGAISVAGGVYWQEMMYRSLKDEILRSGDVSGFNAEDNISGRVSNSDFFAEVYVPILSGLPLVHNLGFTAGYRYSDHNISGPNDSYKGELDWSVVESVRVRGSYQRAVRAPNIAELFSPQNEDNPQVEDPCNVNSAGFRDGPNAAQVEALCIAQGIPASALATYTQSNSQIDALSGGNPELLEETADTFTVGVVWEPQFAQRLSMSLDYYAIEVEDAITFVDPSLVVSKCFNGDGTNPTYDPSNFYCSLFGRFAATSEIADLQETQNNIGAIETSGLDLQVDWGFDIGNAGDIGLNFVASYLEKFERQEAEGEPFLDYVGTIGDDPGDTIPDYKMTLTGTWSIGPVTTALRVRYLPGMDHEDSVISGPSPDNTDVVDSVTYMDLSAMWQATEALSLRVGVVNLTDEDPQLYEAHVDSGTDPSTYDVIGRRYFANVNYRF